jgi:hypothetical protein
LLGSLARQPCSAALPVLQKNNKHNIASAFPAINKTFDFDPVFRR